LQQELSTLQQQAAPGPRTHKPSRLTSCKSRSRPSRR
jgi:hypothetical protein